MKEEHATRREEEGGEEEERKRKRRLTLSGKTSNLTKIDKIPGGTADFAGPCRVPGADVRVVGGLELG